MTQEQKFDDPQWVNAELEKLNRHVFVDGEDFGEHSYAAYWAGVGGNTEGDPLTAVHVNKGQLLDVTR